MKKCPPGIICFESVSIVLLVLFASILGCMVYWKQSEQPLQAQAPLYPSQYFDSPSVLVQDYYGISNSAVAHNGGGWMQNPFAPPLKPVTMPVNVPTNVGASRDASYRQVGILNPKNGSSKDSILPLMGRVLFANRNKWQYFTTSNQHNNVKLPLSRGGKSCTNEYGCDELFSGDTVFIEGSNEVYTVTIYDNDTIRYLPF